MVSNGKEYKGKNIEGAIDDACADLGLGREALDIEIISAGSAGIFGLGKRQALIRVRPKVAPPTAAEAEPGRQAAARPHAKPGQRGQDERTPSRTARKPTPAADGAERAEEAMAPAEPPSTEVIEAIREMTAKLLALIGFPLAVGISHSGTTILAHIPPGDHTGELIGRDGSVLDAIQYLLRKMVAQRFPGRLTLSLDVGTYRADRQNELRELALDLAQKVKASGKSQMISALNPAERRIVHVALQDDEAIRSASIGEGLFKKVRIYRPGRGGRRRAPGGRRGDAASTE